MQLFGRQKKIVSFPYYLIFIATFMSLLATPPICPTPPNHQAPLCQCPAKTHLLRRLSFRGNGCWVGEECLHEVSWYLRASCSTNGRAQGITEILGCQFSSGSPSSFFSLCLFFQLRLLSFFLFIPVCCITAPEAHWKTGGGNTWLFNVS